MPSSIVLFEIVEFYCLMFRLLFHFFACVQYSNRNYFKITKAKTHTAGKSEWSYFVEHWFAWCCFFGVLDMFTITCFFNYLTIIRALQGKRDKWRRSFVRTIDIAGIIHFAKSKIHRISCIWMILLFFLEEIWHFQFTILYDLFSIPCSFFPSNNDYLYLAWMEFLFQTSIYVWCSAFTITLNT